MLWIESKPAYACSAIWWYKSSVTSMMWPSFKSIVQVFTALKIMLDFAQHFWNYWLCATRCFGVFLFFTQKCFNPFYFCRVICKLLASKSESIRVQALKVLGYFLKHLGHKWVPLSGFGLLYDPSWSSVLSMCQIITNKGTLNLNFFLQWLEHKFFPRIVGLGQIFSLHTWKHTAVRAKERRQCSL